MDDLISRKAAIAELDHAAWGKEYDKALAKAMLESLPPTRSEIIRCKDCKHYNAGYECLIEGYGIERNKNWYCADAERRTDGTDARSDIG